MAKIKKPIVQVHMPQRTHYDGKQTVDHPLPHPTPERPILQPDMSVHNSFPSFIKVRKGG